jgi:hypothetical protein
MADKDRTQLDCSEVCDAARCVVVFSTVCEADDRAAAREVLVDVGDLAVGEFLEI